MSFREYLEQELNEAKLKNKIKKTIGKAINFFTKGETNVLQFIVPYSKSDLGMKEERALIKKTEEKYKLFINGGILVNDGETGRWWQVDLVEGLIDKTKKFKDSAYKLEDQSGDDLYTFITGIGYEADIEDFCKKELKTDKYATINYKW